MGLFKYFFYKNSTNNSQDQNTRVLFAPISGQIIEIKDVPDVVIAERILGDGLAFIPNDEVLLAPCDGILNTISPAQNGFALRTADNILVYVSYGLGLEQLGQQGQAGCECRLKLGDQVQRGQPIIYLNLPLLSEQVQSSITSLIVISENATSLHLSMASGHAKAGVTPCIWIEND